MIVDDEPLAQKVIEKYITSLDSLALVKKCDNGLEALSYLHQNRVDIIFLDIKMPELSGLEFLETLNQRPHIIITTAFSEHALKGYEYSIVDYLLKPIAFHRFLKAVNKILGKPKNPPVTIPAKSAEFMFVKADKVDHKIFFSELKYIEGCGNYLKIFTDKGKILISERLSSIEKSLPREQFIRTHKSYIVSIRRIELIKDNKIHLEEKKIPIGSTYKKNFIEIIERYRI